MVKLSLCIITKDEECNIKDCLESVRDIVDEIVLVDTGSTDSTIEIASEYGARIFQTSWHDNFAAAKNQAIRHATEDWILALDADERLSSASRRKIQQLLVKPEYQAYLLQQFSPYPLANSVFGVSTALSIRLFQNNIGLRYRGRIHEQIVPYGRRKEIDVANTNITFEHLGYMGKLKQKYQRNLSVARKRKTKHDAFSRYDLARIYTGLQRYPEAKKSLMLGLEFTEAAAWLRAQMYVLLGDILLQMKNNESSAAVYWVRAAEIEPKAVYPRLRLGTYHYKRKEFEAAAEQFENIIQLLSIGSLRGVFLDYECKLSDAYASLSACYAKMGRREEAMEAIYQSRNLVPENDMLEIVPLNIVFS